MNCEKCGKLLSENSNFCRFCGNPVKIDEDKNIDNSITDKIDISKINIESLKKDNEVDDEIGDITAELDMKVEAMKEISKTQSFVLNSVEPSPVETIPTEEKKEETDDILNIEFMPGTISKLDIDSTSELKKMLLPDEVDKEDDFDTKLIPDSINELKINKIELEQEKMIESEILKEGKDNANSKEQEVCPKTEKTEEIVKEEVIIQEPVLLKEKNDIVESKESEKKLEESKVTEIIDSEKKLEESNTNESEQIITPIINSVFDNKDDEEIKVKKGKGCLVFCLMFPLIIASVIFGIYFYNENSKLNSQNLKYEKKVESLEEELSKKDDIKIVSDSKSIDFNGFNIKFFKDYSYNIIEDVIIISNNQNLYYTNIKEEKYSNIKGDLDSYVSLIEEQEYEIISHGTKVIDDREYVFFELSDSLKNNNLVAYTKLSEDTVVAVFVKFEQNTIDYDILIEYNGIVDCFNESDEAKTVEFDFFEGN